MAARSSKGVKICIVKGGATGVTLTISAATKAAPSVLTVTGDTGIVPGSVIKLANNATGLTELDGKTWIAGPNTTTGSLELLGSDASASTGTFSAGASVSTGYAEGDMVCLCLSQIGFNPETPQTISVGTFCDPGATLPSGVTGAGTASFAGYVDVTQDDYKELVAAEADRNPREFRILLPNNGYMTFPGTVGSLNLDIPIEGAIGYSGTITLGAKPRHLYS